MKNDPNEITVHHRKASSLGGKDVPSNKSYFPRYIHEAWHTLFDNHEVTKILELFEEYWYLFGNDPKPDSEKQRIREWIYAKESRVNKLKAWRCLFKNLTLEEVIREINDVWIDPDYVFVVATVQIPKVAVTTRYSKSR